MVLQPQFILKTALQPKEEEECVNGTRWGLIYNHHHIYVEGRYSSTTSRSTTPLCFSDTMCHSTPLQSTVTPRLTLSSQFILSVDGLVVSLRRKAQVFSPGT